MKDNRRFGQVTTVGRDQTDQGQNTFRLGPTPLDIFGMAVHIIRKFGNPAQYNDFWKIFIAFEN